MPRPFLTFRFDSRNQEEEIRTTRSLRILSCSAACVAAVHLTPQRLVAQEEPPDRWGLSAEFSLTDQSGNRVLTLVTGGLKVSHLQRDRFRLDASLRSRYGRSEGDLVALSHNGSVGFDFRPEDRWSPFLFTDAERDEFKRLDLRLSSGAGAKHTFHRVGSDEISLSLALLHTYERIAPEDVGEGEPRGPALTDHLARWSVRARTAYQIRDGATLRHTTFLQPVWNDMADYLLRSDTGLKILLTERLALSVEYQLTRDSRPPEGVDSNDRLLTTGLIIEF